MKTHILFIHGAGGGAHAEDRKMVDTLQAALGHGYEIAYPPMPDEDAPKYGPWKDAILQHIADLPKDSVLVGHSLGGSVLLKCISEEKAANTFAGIFILGAPMWGGDEDWQFEGYKLRKDAASKLAGTPLFFYHNEDDEIVSSTHLEMYQEMFPDAVTRMGAKGGHQFDVGVADIAKDIKSL